MDPVIWQRIEALFHSARQRPAGEQAAFVRQHSQEDPRVEAEVLSLLQNLDSADEPFLQCQELARRVGEELADAITQSRRWPAEAASANSPASGSDRDADGPRNTDSPRNGQDSQNRQHGQHGQRGKTSRDLAALARQIQSTHARFQDIQVVDQGGNGIVFRGIDNRLGRPVALKVLTRASSSLEELRNDLLKESHAIAQVKGPNLVTVYEVISTGDLPVLVTEFIEGVSLAEFIRQNAPLDPHEAAWLAQQVATGLAVAHRKHLIHQDIKPQNILLETGQAEATPPVPKIIDFGLAEYERSEDRLEDADPGQSGSPTVAGTVSYMSPEQLSPDQPVDARTDLYSLGVTLYEMLTGERPFRGARNMVINQILKTTPKPPRQMDDRIPRDLESICLKAMSRETSYRYQSARQLAEDLERFLNGVPTLARPLGTLEKLTRWSRRHWNLALLGAAVLLLFLTLLVGSWVTTWVVSAKNRQLREKDRAVLEARISAVARSEPGGLAQAIDAIASEPEIAIPLLRQIADDPGKDPLRRLNANSALCQIGDRPIASRRVQGVAEAIAMVPTNRATVSMLVRSFQSAPREAERALHRHYQIAGSDEMKLRLALLQYYLGNPRTLLELVEPQADPGLRTRTIQLVANWNPGWAPLFRLIESETRAPVVSALICGIGLADIREFHRAEQLALRSLLDQLAKRPDAVGSSALWARHRLGMGATVPQIATGALSGSDGGPVERVGDSVLRLVRIPAGECILGELDETSLFEGNPPRSVRLSRDYLMSDREITVGLYQQFLDDAPGPGSAAAANPLAHSHPQQAVTWTDAVRFCNWLSEQTGRQPCYSLAGKKLSIPAGTGEDGSDSTLEIEDWQCDFTADGFRLPTEAEFEYACRARSQTRFCFGNDETLLPLFAEYSNNRDTPTAEVATHLPNAWGLFDIHGNVWEWCWDWYGDLSNAASQNPPGPARPPIRPPARAYRGGGVGTMAGDPVSASRGFAAPDQSFSNLGFRVVRRVE